MQDYVMRLKEQIAELKQTLQNISLSVLEQRHGLEKLTSEFRASLDQSASGSTPLYQLPSILRTILDDQSVGALLVGVDGRCLLSNAVAESILGAAWVRNVEPLPTDCGLFLSDKETRCENYNLPWQECARGANTQEVLLFLRRAEVRNGIWIRTVSMPLRDEKNESNGAVAFLLDVTEQIQVEEQIRQLLDALEQQLASIEMAHVLLSQLTLKLTKTFDQPATQSRNDSSPALNKSSPSKAEDILASLTPVVSNNSTSRSATPAGRSIADLLRSASNVSEEDEKKLTASDLSNEATEHLAEPDQSIKNSFQELAQDANNLDGDSAYSEYSAPQESDKSSSTDFIFEQASMPVNEQTLEQEPELEASPEFEQQKTFNGGTSNEPKPAVLDNAFVQNREEKVVEEIKLQPQQSEFEENQFREDQIEQDQIEQDQVEQDQVEQDQVEQDQIDQDQLPEQEAEGQIIAERVEQNFQAQPEEVDGQINSDWQERKPRISSIGANYGGSAIAEPDQLSSNMPTTDNQMPVEESQTETELENEAIPEALSAEEQFLLEAAKLARSLTKSVLIVDDIPVNQKLLRLQLSRLGFTIHSVSNGQEAVEAVMKEEFDLIFMDLDMPVMNGPSAAAAIRRLERETNKHVPIIAMTSYDRDIDRQASINSGMDDYLVKGATQKELTEVINKFLGQIAEPEVESALPGQLGDSIYAVDLDSLKNLLGQTELEEVFRLFNSSISTFVESMYLSIEERNASAVNHFANCIKGPTAQMNLDKLTLVLSKIIAASENGDWLRVGQEYLKLRTGFSETLTQMKNMCEPHPHSQAGLVSEVS